MINNTRSKRKRAVSVPENGKGGKLAATLFLGVFLLFGLGFSIPFAWSGYKILTSLTWEKTPCVIESSWVERHDSSDGDTFSVEVRYRYFFRGEEHPGERYRFTFGSSSGRRFKDRVIARYPAGSDAFCYVNPRDPSDSVINRKPGFELLFVLLPMVFVLIGGGGLAAIYGLLPQQWSAPGKQTWRPKARQPTADAGSSFASSSIDPNNQPPRAIVSKPGQRHLPTDPSSSPSGEVRFDSGGRVLPIVLMLLLVAGFGAANVFLWKESGGCFIWVFRIGFGSALVALVGGLVHAFLSLFNPRVTLFLAPGSPVLGDDVSVRYQAHGRLNRIVRLRLSLQGVEEAKYRRGTDTVTDTHVFHDITLAEMRQGTILPRGNYTANIPVDAMHSFKARNNRILWRLELEGEIPTWPDVGEKHEFVVRLPAVSPARGGFDGSETGDNSTHVDSHLPGSTLERTIDWMFEDDPERVEVRLVWYTSGKGDQDLSVVDTVEIEPPRRQGSQSVRFDLPEGPFSYAGRLVSIGWALDVIAFPSLESHRVELVVAPKGIGEIRV